MDFSHSSKSGTGRSDNDGNLNADNIPENSREVVQILKKILNRSEQDIYAMLVECNMDAEEAINRLRSQDGFQQGKSKQDKKKEAKGKSKMGRRYEETSNVQGIRNHLAGSSTASCTLGPHPSLNSDVSNVETKGVTISSGDVVPSLSMPSSRYQSAQGCCTSGQGLGSLKESVTKAPVKDDSLLPEKPVVPNSFSNSFTESASVSNQNVRDGDYGGSRLLCDNYNNKNDESNQVQRRSIEHNQSGMDGPGEPSGLPSRFLDDDSEGISDYADRFTLSYQNIIRFLDDTEDIPDCADALTLSNLNIRDGERHEEEQQRLRRNVGNEQMNQHYSQPNLPSGHYGTVMSHHYSLPTQYNPYWPPSPYQQHGGSNNNVYVLPSIVAPPPQYINSDLWHAHHSIPPYGSGMFPPQFTGPVNPSHLSFGVGLVQQPQFFFPVDPSQYGYNSSNVWTPPQGHNDSSGRNYYSLLPGHQNQQSPSFIHGQQQEQPYRGTGYYASQHHPNNIRDPSNPTQQPPSPRNN